MGGGSMGGHRMVVALHLYKLLKSSRKFTELMTKNFDTTIKGVNCLIPFNDQLKVGRCGCGLLCTYSYRVSMYTVCLLVQLLKSLHFTFYVNSKVLEIKLNGAMLFYFCASSPKLEIKAYL